MTFGGLTPFAEAFVNSDWLELVITNKMMNKMPSRPTFQMTAIYTRQVCATFGMETFQEEQQKAIDLFRYQLAKENR